MTQAEIGRLGAMFEKLVKHGSVLTGEVEIKREGEQINLPPGMSYTEGIQWLERKRDAELADVEIIEVIPGFAFDAANAFNMAVKEIYGMTAMDDYRNSSENVPINAAGDTINVFLGTMRIPGIDGKVKIFVKGNWDATIVFNVKEKDRAKVTALMALARKFVRERSIYKGKAFKLKWQPPSLFAPGGFAQPEFIATGMRGQLQVNPETLELVQAGVWTPIQQSARARTLNIPLKRAALLEGPYGTGKTLFSAETATISEENGWTFIYLTDINKLAEGYQAARKYQPAVLFAEDVDLLMSGGEDDVPEAVRNTLDGIDTKRSEVIVILTTNHLDKLPKSILRPGRLDAVVPFRPPNPETVQKLIRQYAGDLLEANEPLAVVGKILNGQIPAVIREVVERSKLHAMGRPGNDIMLTGDDLAKAAHGMKHHLDLLNRELVRKPSAMQQVGTAIGETLVLAGIAARNGHTELEDEDLADGYHLNPDQSLLEGALAELVTEPGR